MEKIKLSKIERKILFALNLYSYARIGYRELNGYLHFLPLETTYTALGNLEKRGLIREAEKDWYVITEEGKEQMKFRPFADLMSKEMKVGLVCAIAGAVLQKLLG